MNRRHLLAGSASALAASTVLASPALAQQGPLKLGWLVPLTGPNATSGIGTDRGVVLGAAEINKAGGIGGRKVEIVTRDTQGDPTKAVNAALELINNEKVHIIIGPTLSGEALATTAVVARAKIPTIVMGTVDSLVDAEKYPYAFRLTASVSGWVEAANRYSLDILKAKRIAILSESTGFGTVTGRQSESTLKAAGATVSFTAFLDPNLTDLTTEMQKAKESGAEAMIVWTGSAGLVSRILNARAEVGWEVPLVGHPAMGTGSVLPLLTKPANWENVYIVGFRAMTYDDQGKLPAQTEAFLDMARKSTAVDDTTLWWIANGYDTVQLVRHAFATAGSEKAEDFRKALEGTRDLQLLHTKATFTPANHNNQAIGLVMNRANSFRAGAYSLAPGYGGQSAK